MLPATSSQLPINNCFVTIYFSSTGWRHFPLFFLLSSLLFLFFSLLHLFCSFSSLLPASSFRYLFFSLSFLIFFLYFLPLVYSVICLRSASQQGTSSTTQTRSGLSQRRPVDKVRDEMRREKQYGSED